MANEDKKDFNAMLHKDTDMPKVQIVTDEKTIQKYGGSRMYFAPTVHYDEVMKRIPAVSYTHLDVYKRQVYDSGSLLSVGQSKRQHSSASSLA